MPNATGILEAAAESVLPAFADRARSLGADVAEEGPQVTVTARLGTIAVLPHPRGLQLNLQAPEPRQLGELIELVNGFCTTGLGKLPHWMGLEPPKITMTEVVSVTQISPNFRRVRLKGDFSPFLDGKSLHFRFCIGPEGADWPKMGENGLEWPGGVDAWHRPPYTVSALDPEGKWLETDVFVHAGGRVTEWTESAQPGEAMMITGPGGKAVRQAEWMGLVGDETALPVILRALQAAAPGTRGQAFVLVPDTADAQPVTLPEGMRLDWVTRAPGLDLLSLLARLDPPEGVERSVFFAGEREDVARAREIASAKGLAPGEFRAASYWTAGWVPPASQRQPRRKPV